MKILGNIIEMINIEKNNKKKDNAFRKRWNNFGPILSKSMSSRGKLKFAHIWETVFEAQTLRDLNNNFSLCLFLSKTRINSCLWNSYCFQSNTGFTHLQHSFAHWEQELKERKNCFQSNCQSIEMHFSEKKRQKSWFRRTTVQLIGTDSRSTD